MVQQPRIHPPPPPSTPRLAPWDAVQELCNRLDRLITLLEGVTPPAPPPEWPGWEPVISKLNEIKEQLRVLEITAPWVAKEPEVLFDRAITSAATVDADKMVNWTRGKRLIIKVESLLDQDCDIQVVGNITDNYDLATDINAAITCLANGNISIGLAWDDWHPFVGVRITTAIAPSADSILTISAVVQE